MRAMLRPAEETARMTNARVVTLRVGSPYVPALSGAALRRE